MGLHAEAGGAGDEEAFGWTDRGARGHVAAAPLACCQHQQTDHAGRDLLARQGRIDLSDRVFGPGAVTGTDYGWPPYRPDLVRFFSHLSGFSPPAHILKPQTIMAMTTAAAANPGYAKEWAVKGGNWWHNGSLPGTSSLAMRTRNGLCWAAFTNMRRDSSLGADLDRLV